MGKKGSTKSYAVLIYIVVAARGFNMSQTQSASFKQGGSYAWFVVFVLCITSIFAYLDRQIINLLVEPIKADLGINDTQIGLLTGFSFALLYVLVAVPIAWIADFGNRTRVITIGIICWALATFFCGLATSFLLLFVARMFVGLGEATLAPSGYSLMGDYFPPEKVGLAVSCLTGAGFLGGGLAYIIGGQIVGMLNQVDSYTLPLIGMVKPWQLAFMVVAIPGLLLVLLMQFVKEPPRSSAIDGDLIKLRAKESFSALFRYIRQNLRLFVGLFMGLALMASATFSIMNWMPEYMSRSFGWTPQKFGNTFGTIILVTSPSGVFAGGLIASWWMPRGKQSANVIIPIIAAILATVFGFLFLQASTESRAIAFGIPTIFFAAMPFGCGTAALPLVTPNRLRAQVVAIYLLCANLLGLTLGPTAVGAVTDYVFKDESRLGDSLSVVAPVLYLAGALVLLMAVKPYAQIIRKQEAPPAE